MERNYKREYKNYHSKPEQRKNRSSRNIARRLMAKRLGKAKLAGKDVDHKDSTPRNNSPSNLTQAEKDAFNDTIDNGSTEQVKIAVQGLMSKAGMSPNSPQQNMFEGSVNNTNTDSFGSVAQVTEAMNDPRYSKDPAYRKEVEEKLARSTVI